jgi:hypothetical protein
MKLLYRTAEWHGFAKLRVHTDSTVGHLDVLTKEFGFLMRQFRDKTCSQYQTTELPQEVATRKRQELRAQAKVSSGRVVASSRTTSTTDHHDNTAPASHVYNSTPTQSSASRTRRHKTLNLFTTKFHSLGDYVHTIQNFGCTDSYSTQVV